MRTIVAEDALSFPSIPNPKSRKRGVNRYTGEEGNTYKNPNERIKSTENFVLGVIFNFLTKKIGNNPNDQSVTALITA